MTIDDRLSQQAYSMTVEKDVMVPMRDGVKVAVDIYRPDAPGKFPALLSVSPLGKDCQALPLPPGYGMNGEWPHIEAGDSEFWATRGYVHVIANARGTGRSEGDFQFWFSRHEQEDGHDIVEWMAEQEWCDGNVGMCGISWFAISQYMTAAQQPPHLKAIFPHDGWGDLYRDICYHGGMYTMAWAPHLRPRIYAHSYTSASKELYSEEELAEKVEEARQRGSVNLSPYLWETLINPSHDPATFDLLLHPNDGPFYQERSAYTKWDRITIPVHLGSEMHNAYTVAMHLPGAISAWNNLTGPKRMTFRNYVGGVERPFRAFHDEMLRWYDHWLKGIDTGLLDEPPVKIWIRGADRFRLADDWPIPGTEWHRHYLCSDGTLSRTEPPADDGTVRFTYEPVMPNTGAPMPLDPHRPEHVEYVLAMTEPTTVIGPIALHFWATIDQPDTNWIVKLKHVAADGTEEIISRGWLRAAHRALDEERSTELAPWHPHTHDEPVEPGVPQRYSLTIQPIAVQFAPGEQLKLEIWPADVPPDSPEEMDWTLMYPMLAHLPNPLRTEHTLLHDAEHRSYLLLPDPPAEADGNG